MFLNDLLSSEEEGDEEVPQIKLDMLGLSSELATKVSLKLT